MSAANVLRDHGHDPAEVSWYANDIDPIAIACLAVNAHLWDLGPRVLFAVADTITQPDWVPAALAARQTALDEMRSVRLIAAFEALTGASCICWQDRDFTRDLASPAGETP